MGMKGGKDMIIAELEAETERAAGGKETWGTPSVQDVNR